MGQESAPGRGKADIMQTAVMRPVVGVALLMLTASPCAGQRPLSYSCRRAPASVRIDGYLFDAAWRIAGIAPLEHLICPELEGDATIEAPVTRAWAAWDDDCLYIAFRSRDTDVWGTKRESDDSLWEEDVVEVYLDPDGDQRNYREFEVNPLGTTIDLLIPQAGDQVDWRSCAAWNACGMRAVARVFGEGAALGSPDAFWTAEMAIPWSAFAGAPHLPPQVGDRWRGQFYRIDRPADPHDALCLAWSPTPTFHAPRHFGWWTFKE
jgi:hypothetical protein